MQGPSLPWDFVWKMKILPKHILFAWCVLQNKQPTRARIAKWDNTIHPGCPICRDGDETMDQLLAASCSFARSVWQHLPPSIPKPTSSVSFWFWHQASPENRRIGTILMWYLWKVRNHYLFHYHPVHPQQAFTKTISAIFYWNVSHLYMQVQVLKKVSLWTSGCLHRQDGLS